MAIIKPGYTAYLEDKHSCSDGFIVDTTPPSPGYVNIGFAGSTQHDNTQLQVHWGGFADIEEIGAELTHESGISHYILEIGKNPAMFYCHS